VRGVGGEEMSAERLPLKSGALILRINLGRSQPHDGLLDADVWRSSSAVNRSSASLRSNEN